MAGGCGGDGWMVGRTPGILNERWPQGLRESATAAPARGRARRISVTCAIRWSACVKITGVSRRGNLTPRPLARGLIGSITAVMVRTSSASASAAVSGRCCSERLFTGLLSEPPGRNPSPRRVTAPGHSGQRGVGGLAGLFGGLGHGCAGSGRGMRVWAIRREAEAGLYASELEARALSCGWCGRGR